MTNPAVSRWITRGLALAILLLLFATGVATGFGIARWTGHSHERARAESFRGPHYYSALGLDAQQEQAVNAIYEKYRPALDAVLEETTPRVRAIHEQIEQEVKALLTPAQLERLERLRERRSHRRAGRGMGRMGPGMMGPMDGLGPHR